MEVFWAQSIVPMLLEMRLGGADAIDGWAQGYEVHINFLSQDAVAGHVIQTGILNLTY